MIVTKKISEFKIGEYGYTTGDGAWLFRVMDIGLRLGQTIVMILPDTPFARLATLNDFDLADEAPEWEYRDGGTHYKRRAV